MENIAKELIDIKSEINDIVEILQDISKIEKMKILMSIYTTLEIRYYHNQGGYLKSSREYCILLLATQFENLNEIVEY